MVLNAEVTYRKAKKEDFPAVVELIRKNNQSQWEYENEKTAKRLSKMFFHEAMMVQKSFWVAVYKNQVVGAIMIGKKQQIRPIYRMKRFLQSAKLKMSKEGRNNLKNILRINEMKEEISSSRSTEGQDQILHFYVEKNYWRNGIGTGLLEHAWEHGGLTVCVDQKCNYSFLEKHQFTKKAQTSEMMDVNKQRYRLTIMLYEAKK